MTKANYKKIGEEMVKALEDFSSGANTLNAYDYEKGFREITDKYNRVLFEASLGDPPKSKNDTNTIKTSFGNVEVKKKPMP